MRANICPHTCPENSTFEGSSGRPDPIAQRGVPPHELPLDLCFARLVEGHEALLKFARWFRVDLFDSTSPQHLPSGTASRQAWSRSRSARVGNELLQQRRR
jgi:hypothetical protein